MTIYSIYVRYNMWKRLLTAFIAAALIIIAASCGGGKGNNGAAEPFDPGTELADPAINNDPVEPEPETDLIRVGYTSEEASAGYALLFQDGIYSEYETGAALAAALSAGEIDTAVIPTNLACSFYLENGGTVSILGLCTDGDVWFVESSDEDSLYADSVGPDYLYGRTVYIPYEKGAEDAAAHALADKNGLIIGQTVYFEYLPYADIEEQVRSESGSFAAVSEPLQERYELGFSGSWAWKTLTGADFCPIYCVAINRETVNGGMLEALKTILSANEGFITGETAILDTATPYLRACYRVDPLLIGGHMPDDGLYE